MDVINKFAPKADADAIIYILKDKLDKIKTQGHMICEYKMSLRSDYNGDYYYTNLEGLIAP